MRNILIALALALAGCTTSPYASLSSGVYACSTQEVENTCETALVDQDFEQTLVGNDEVLTLQVPGFRVGLGEPGGSGTLQLGAGDDPTLATIEEGRYCEVEPIHTMRSTTSVEITDLGTDALTYHVRYAYAELGPCAPPSAREGACEVAFETTCQRR
jgi:hypothetical protein